MPNQLPTHLAMSRQLMGYRERLATAAAAVVVTATVVAPVSAAAAADQQDDQDKDPARVVTAHCCLPPFEPSLAYYVRGQKVCRNFYRAGFTGLQGTVFPCTAGNRPGFTATAANDR